MYLVTPGPVAALSFLSHSSVLTDLRHHSQVYSETELDQQTDNPTAESISAASYESNGPLVALVIELGNQERRADTASPIGSSRPNQVSSTTDAGAAASCTMQGYHQVGPAIPGSS